jgi:c-di-GMP-binding flagellar brake protein YcgR
VNLIDDQDPKGNRRWKRFRVDLRLKVTTVRNGQRAFSFGQGSDVSEGGMAAYIPAELELGEMVEVEIKLPYSKDTLLMKCSVRNRNGFRYGLECVLINESDREQLKKSLKALSLVQ